MGLGVRILLERSEGEMPTTTDYVSSVSLLPTVEFLELVAKKQWDSTVSYGLGVSTIVPMFHSTTNSEWLCLNSESEFLTSPQGTVSIKNPFAYTRPESSPVYISYSDISIPKNKINGAKSLFLFRIDEDGKNEVITVSNYDKTDKNVTTAPPIDCFSRECLTWFSSDVDWFFGFGVTESNLGTLANESDIISLSSSKDIATTIVSSSKIPIDAFGFSPPTQTSPFVTVILGTSVFYESSSPDYVDVNLLFVYSINKDNESLSAFVGQYDSPVSNVDYEEMKIIISWLDHDIIIL
jgi:hypothetical protein